jgi:signal transduction histidine kinase
MEPTSAQRELQEVRRRIDDLAARAARRPGSEGDGAVDFGEELGALAARLGGLERDAHAAAEVLSREQAARLQAETVARREAYLTGAGVILAGSLDLRATLSSVARLVVPRVADSCIVYTVEEDGGVRRLAAAHRDADTERLLQDGLVDVTLDADTLVGSVARVLRRGEPEMIPEMDPVGGPGAPRSQIVVPLRIRERVLGAVSLGWDEPGRYTPDAFWLASRIADRAALAIENARLHGAVRHADEAKSEFVAAMSHEFRTPLTTILAFAELLVDGVPEPIGAVPREHAQRILHGARHLTELVDQVLTVARIEARLDDVEISEVDLAELADSIAALMEPLARQRGLDLRLDLPGTPCVAGTDPGRLRQVLLNLIGNAVKFTERGHVTLSLRCDPATATIEVADTGPGIPSADLDRIWEPFWQGRAGGARPPGTGLGLGIVRRLVHRLGGEILVDSREGSGTRFSVRIDRRARER